MPLTKRMKTLLDRALQDKIGSIQSKGLSADRLNAEFPNSPYGGSHFDIHPIPHTYRKYRVSIPAGEEFDVMAPNTASIRRQMRTQYPGIRDAAISEVYGPYTQAEQELMYNDRLLPAYYHRLEADARLAAENDFEDSDFYREHLRKHRNSFDNYGADANDRYWHREGFDVWDAENDFADKYWRYYAPEEKVELDRWLDNRRSRLPVILSDEVRF